MKAILRKKIVADTERSREYNLYMYRSGHQNLQSGHRIEALEENRPTRFVRSNTNTEKNLYTGTL